MICWPTAQLAAAERKYMALHEDQPFHDGTQTVFMDKPTQMTPFHVLDGMAFYLSETDENPGDDFTTNRYAKLPSVVVEQAPSNEGQAEQDEE